MYIHSQELKVKGFYLSLALMLALSVVSCSMQQKAHLRGLQLALKDNPGFSLSAAAVKDSKVDLIYVVKGDLPRTVVALAAIENGQYKWVSADDVMLATASGRIVRTLGLSSNLIAYTNLAQDPLQRGQHAPIGSRWTYYADYDSPTSFNMRLMSEIVASDQETISILGHDFSTQVITEKVVHPRQFLDSSWTNKFWYERSSGNLIKSTQRITPDSDLISITYISSAMRLISGNSKSSGQ